MQVYTINHNQTADVIISCQTMAEALLMQSAYKLQDCTYIACLPVAKKSLIDSISADNCFNLLCKAMFYGLPLLVGYMLLNF